MRRDVEVVNVCVPIGANGALGRHDPGVWPPDAYYKIFTRDSRSRAAGRTRIRRARGGRRDLRPDDRLRRRAARACRSRSSIAAISAPPRHSIISRPSTAGCATCSRPIFGACASRFASGARLRASLRAGSRRWRSPCRPVASLTRNPIAMRAALALDALVGRDRNEGVDPARQLPAGRIIAGAECRELFDGAIRSVAVGRGLARLSDGQRRSSHAGVRAWRGSTWRRSLRTTSKPLRPLRLGGKLAGVHARDALTGQAFDVRARMLVNAAGPWAATVLAIRACGPGGRC